MKSGFVSIIGRPNVGKSTLLNAILDFKVAIISNKAGTQEILFKEFIMILIRKLFSWIHPEFINLKIN